MSVDLLLRCRCVNDLVHRDQSGTGGVRILIEQNELTAAWSEASRILQRDVCCHPNGTVGIYTPGTVRYVEMLTFARNILMQNDSVGSFPICSTLLHDYMNARNSLVTGLSLIQLRDEIDLITREVKNILVPIIDRLDTEDCDYQMMNDRCWTVTEHADGSQRWTFCVEGNQIVICSGSVTSWENFTAASKWRFTEAAWDEQRGGYVDNVSGLFCPCSRPLWTGTARLTRVPAWHHYSGCLEVIEVALSTRSLDDSILEISI